MLYFGLGIQGMKRLSIHAGDETKQACEPKDVQRMKKSDLQATEKEKKRRQGEKIIRTLQVVALREAEGVTYEAGGF